MIKLQLISILCFTLGAWPAVQGKACSGPIECKLANPCPGEKTHKCHPVETMVCENRSVPKCGPQCRPEPNCVPGTMRQTCRRKRTCAVEYEERCSTIVERKCPEIKMDAVQYRDPSISAVGIIQEELWRSLKDTIHGRDLGCWNAPNEKCVQLPVNKCYFENKCQETPRVCRLVCHEVCRAIQVNACLPKMVQKCETIVSAQC